MKSKNYFYNNQYQERKKKKESAITKTVGFCVQAFDVKGFRPTTMDPSSLCWRLLVGLSGTGCTQTLDIMWRDQFPSSRALPRWIHITARLSYVNVVAQQVRKKFYSSTKVIKEHQHDKPHVYPSTANVGNVLRSHLAPSILVHCQDSQVKSRISIIMVQTSTTVLQKIMLQGPPKSFT